MGENGNSQEQGFTFSKMRSSPDSKIISFDDIQNISVTDTVRKSFPYCKHKLMFHNNYLNMNGQ